MNDLRQCANTYRCGKGTKEACRKALCPFFNEKMSEPKPTRKLTFIFNSWDELIRRNNETAED